MFGREWFKKAFARRNDVPPEPSQAEPGHVDPSQAEPAQGEPSLFSRAWIKQVLAWRKDAPTEPPAVEPSLTAAAPTEMPVEGLSSESAGQPSRQFWRNPRWREYWLDFDSRIDSSFHESFAGFGSWWSAYSTFFGRFHISGLPKFAVNISSDALTLGILGLIGAYSIAQTIEEVGDNFFKVPYAVTFLDRYGNEIGKRGILRDDAVTLEEIPEHLKLATLATEDRRFYEHFGIDIVGTFRALVENVKANDVVQGGSSITQQLAKNRYLTSERSIWRKVKEAFLAIKLEHRFTKDEILKHYFDYAYLGGGAFGVEAASQFYFGKSVREVTLAESAMLAGLFKAPTRFAPHQDLAAARARANVVLTNMVEWGKLTEGQVHGARLNPATPIDRTDLSAPNYYLDWAYEEVERLIPMLPAKWAEAKRRAADKRAFEARQAAAEGNEDADVLNNTDTEDAKDPEIGYVFTVRTTLDPTLHDIAKSALQDTLRQNGRAYRVRQAAMVVLEPDGAARAVIGGRDYGESQFNRAVHAFRQPGSSFKAYVYMTALMNGYTPQSRVVDGFVKCGRWSPKNYSGGYRGAMTMADALRRSVNTVAVYLSLYAPDRQVLLDNVHKMGMTNVRKTCSMALGDTGVPPIKHTAGYAVFANGGKKVDAYAILEVRNSADEVIYERAKHETEPERLFPRDKVEQLNRMLHLVVTSGTGRRAQLDFTHAAGKTGTSSSYRDAWFMGFTGRYVTGVWYGNDSYRPMGRVTGGSLPAMTWQKFNAAAHTDMNIPQIPGVPLHPVQQQEAARLAAEEAARRAGRRVQPLPSSKPVAVKGMSEETREVLRALAEKLRTAEQIDANADFTPSPSEQRRTRTQVPPDKDKPDRTAAERTRPQQNWLR